MNFFPSEKQPIYSDVTPAESSKATMLFLSMLAVGVQPVPTPSTLIKLDDPYAVCIDGSPATYYWSKGANATAFLFHHQGGGWCQTTEECSQRARTTLGSSTSYPATKDLRTVDAPPTTPGGAAGTNHFNRDPLQNPLFHDWNYVYMPYCDGNSFAGDAVASAGGKVLNFRGTKIRESVVAHLKSNNGFAAAEHVVVSGCSAGGAATFFHTDWFAEQAPGAKVRGMPDSGWFLNGDYARDGKPDYGSRMENMHSMANTSSGLPTACTAAGLGYKCLFAPNLIQFLKTPIFAINSKFDASMAPGTYNNKMGEVMGDYQCPEWYVTTLSPPLIHFVFC